MAEISVMESIVQRASALQKTIGLPESTDARSIQAARLATDDKLCNAVLVGPKDETAKAAAELGVSLDGIEIVDPAEDALKSENAGLFYELRKHKGISQEDAEKYAGDPLYAATLLLKKGTFDATVAGAVNSTPNVLRPLFQIVGAAPGVSLASSCFVMTTDQTDMGVNGAFIFADCGVNPNPTAEQLADIAISSAESARVYLNAEPKVAMLSFSTKGSASHPDVDKVVEATRIAKEKRPDLAIDGELQADAAIVPSVATAKAPGSDIAGHANVLIFPDLDTGNICYKMTQRLAGAGAFGPLLQGLAKVGMDLSRGSTAEDVYGVMACAAVLSEAME